jgi:phosphoribosylformylglycinamidine synthase
MEITLDDTSLRLDKTLYSESQGRIIVTIAPQNKQAFEALLENYPHVTQIGTVTDTNTLRINAHTMDIAQMEDAYKSPLRDY